MLNGDLEPFIQHLAFNHLSLKKRLLRSFDKLRNLVKRVLGFHLTLSTQTFVILSPKGERQPSQYSCVLLNSDELVRLLRG